MISELLENSLRNLNSNTVTDVFIWLMLIFFLMAVYWTRKNIHNNLKLQIYYALSLFQYLSS